MQTTYIGQEKLIVYGGRYFAMEAADDVVQLEWARRILAAPSVKFPNGRMSHEVAGEVLDEHEDRIIQHYRYVGP